MGWIRNLENAAKAGDSNTTIDYEICSEAHIPGVLNYANGGILCGPLAFGSPQNNLMAYTLRLKFPSAEAERPHDFSSRRGYAFQGGAHGELTALFSLYFHCRFFLVSQTHGELTARSIRTRIEYPLVYRPCKSEEDPVLFGRKPRNFSIGLEEFLDLVNSLPTQYHQKYILACHQFARALTEIGVDSEMVFIRLVSAIEALSAFARLRKNEDRFSDRPIEGFLADGVSTDDVTAIKKVFSVRGSKVKFRRLMLDHCAGFFKGGNYKAPHTKIRKSQLPEILDTIYDSRSVYLHSGEPMYLPIFPGRRNWDTDPSIGMSIDQRNYSVKQKLPYAYFFHSLVRHCLLQFLKRTIQLKE